MLTMQFKVFVVTVIRLNWGEKCNDARFFRQQSSRSREVSGDPPKVPTAASTHPDVFLKPLSAACAALTPPL